MTWLAPLLRLPNNWLRFCVLSRSLRLLLLEVLAEVVEGATSVELFIEAMGLLNKIGLDLGVSNNAGLDGSAGDRKTAANEGSLVVSSLSSTALAGFSPFDTRFWRTLTTWGFCKTDGSPLWLCICAVSKIIRAA